MMAGNIFDQLDALAASRTNIFDQLDAQSQTASLAPADRFGFAGQGAAEMRLPEQPQQPLPQGGPPKRQAEMRSYDPTWREQIAQYMMGDERASPERRRLVGGLMGTTGLPGSEQMGIVDVTPARIPMFAQEAKRAYDEGSYGKAALNALGATPAPILSKAVEGAVGVAGKTINGFRGEPVRQIAQGVDDVAREAPKSARSRMSPAELKAASHAAYKEADEAGVIFTPAGVQRVSREAKEALADFGFDPILHPQAARALERLDEVAAGNVTFKGMDVLRKVTKAAANSPKDEERAVGMMIIEKIDDLMANSRQFETLTGNTPQAADAMKRARDLWGRARRTEMIEEAVVRAERRAGSTGSGGNIDNATRQNLRAILDNQKKARMFSEAERKQIDKVVRGTAGLNTLRGIGKLSPEGNGLMMSIGGAMSAGAFLAHPLMAVPPAAGFVAKRLADRGTNRAVNRLLDDVSSGAKRNALMGP